MPNEGWISLHRKIQDSFVWLDANQLKLWLYCLMKARHKGGEFAFNGEMVKLDEGQFITGMHVLDHDFNNGVKPSQKISGRTLMRWLHLFDERQMLSIKTTSKYSVISVVHWNEYQNVVKPLSSTCQASVKHLSTNNNVNNDNKEHSMSDKSDSRVDFKKFIEWFNQQTGKHFKNTDANQKLIKARLNEGNTKQDLADVVEFKSSEWKDNPEMNKYLRFNTLFAPTHFGDYLNEAKESNSKPHVTSNQIEEVDTEAIHRQQVAKAEEKWRKEHPDE